MQREIIEILSREIGLELYHDLTEDQLIVMICDRVKELIREDKALLVSYLYRLDVEAAKINGALRVTNIIPPHQSIGVLIYERQIERIKSKKKYVQKPIEGWEY